MDSFLNLSEQFCHPFPIELDHCALVDYKRIRSSLLCYAQLPMFFMESADSHTPCVGILSKAILGTLLKLCKQTYVQAIYSRYQSSQFQGIFVLSVVQEKNLMLQIMSTVHFIAMKQGAIISGYVLIS